MFLPSAEDRLQGLQEELMNTEDQLTRAMDQLQHLHSNGNQQPPPGNQLTEDDKEHMRNALSNKMNKVGGLTSFRYLIP